MAVITISRQYGSGGDTIADRVCERLGYKHFDKRDIARAAAEARLSQREIASYADFSEENYKVKKFLDILLRRAHPHNIQSHGLEERIGTLVAEEEEFSEAAALKLVQQAILSAYQSGDTVIVGRGGQIILKDCRGVIHIRVEANLEDRIQRVKDRLRVGPRAHLAEVALRLTAQDLINERDQASSDYVRQFYNADWANPALYHAVLNTSKLDLDQAAQITIDLVKCKGC